MNLVSSARAPGKGSPVAAVVAMAFRDAGSLAGAGFQGLAAPDLGILPVKVGSSSPAVNRGGGPNSPW